MSTPNGNIFGQRLRDLRGLRSKVEFASFLGVSPPVYQRYEKGRIPRGGILSVISQKTGKSVGWLVGLDGVSTEKISEEGVKRTETSAYIEGDQLIPKRLEQLTRDPNVASSLTPEASIELGNLQTIIGLWHELKQCVETNPKHFAHLVTQIHEITDRYTNYLKSRSKPPS